MTRNELFKNIADSIIDEFLTNYIEDSKVDYEEFIDEIASIIETQMSDYEICKGSIEPLE